MSRSPCRSQSETSFDFRSAAFSSWDHLQLLYQPGPQALGEVPPPGPRPHRKKRRRRKQQAGGQAGGGKRAPAAKRTAAKGPAGKRAPLRGPLPPDVRLQQHVDPDDLPKRARLTIAVTACFLLALSMLLVGMTLRMAPIIDDMVRKQNEEHEIRLNRAHLLPPNSTMPGPRQDYHSHGRGS
ncbi:hypothetical protein ONE63_007519 [Megalurothrips usitatus]|uniref:Uncharacterized protein n=1 Tax=Megalurothrips usitatus TaxID=439358 RepID=A0AAV7XN03_9NEOP|nr:hypothetical protein ONE63_007519 [Megalurothrips usitatus]